MSVFESIVEPFYRIYSQHHKTHVANAYSEEIEAKVSATKGEIEIIKEGVNIGVGNATFGIHVGTEKEKHIKYHKRAGFVKIGPGGYISFPVAAEGSFDYKVYVSIIAGSKILAIDFPVKNDCSVIVDENGYLRLTKYGKLWIDEDGRLHKHK